MLPILVKVCGGLLHGGELAGTLFLLGFSVCIGVVRRAPVLSRWSAVAAVVVVSTCVARPAVADTVDIFVVFPR